MRADRNSISIRGQQNTKTKLLTDSGIYFRIRRMNSNVAREKQNKQFAI